jgi:hypothetical protein
LTLGLSRRKPLKFPNIGANCQSKFRGEAPASLREAAFWTAALHPAGEGPVLTVLVIEFEKHLNHVPEGYAKNDLEYLK